MMALMRDERVRTLAVVAYPALSEDDRRWIEGIRARHDPLASRIAAHLTLVFPAEVAEDLLLTEVETALRPFESMAVVLGRAAAVPDPIGGGCHVFLLAEEGQARLHAAHDALYAGVLAAHRRGDVPYVPHVTVGARPHLGACERLARRLNQGHRIVRCAIDDVAVVEVAASSVRTVARMPLSRGARSMEIRRPPP
jgi:2'-5' RNA ligase